MLVVDVKTKVLVMNTQNCTADCHFGGGNGNVYSGFTSWKWLLHLWFVTPWPLKIHTEIHTSTKQLGLLKFNVKQVCIKLRDGYIINIVIL